MNKVYIAAVSLVLIALVGAFLFYKEPCKEPSELNVAITSLGCSLQLMNEDLAAEICKAKGEEPGCVLSEEVDGPLAEGIINSKVRNCTIARLKEDNYCTDQVK